MIRRGFLTHFPHRNAQHVTVRFFRDGGERMGLDVSHGAFSGPYSAFNRFRQSVAKAFGGSWPPHEKPIHDDGIILDENTWYWGDGMSKETNPGLFVFMSHSDCDGSISPEDCINVANELEELLPRLDEMGSGGGHLKRAGGIGRVARDFIAACRQAATDNESLEFQ